MRCPRASRGAPRATAAGWTRTVDTRSNRLTLFDRRGAVLATGRTDGLAVPIPGGFGYVLPWTMRPDGRFTGHFARVTYGGDPGHGVQPTDSIPVPFVLFDVTGRVTDTIGWAGRPPPRMWRPPSEDDSDFRFTEIGGRRTRVPSPPTQLPFWEALPGGYVLIETPLAGAADEGVIRLTRFGLSGDTVYHREIAYTPEPWTGADLDSIAARTARGEEGMVMAQGGGPPAVPDNWEQIARGLRAEMRFPAFKLPVRYVQVMQDESVWLRLLGDDEQVGRWV